MTPLPRADELTIFIPTSDFDLSKRFYQDLGFPLTADLQEEPYVVAHFQVGGTKMVLNKVDLPVLSPYWLFHLLVPDVEEWYQRAQTRQLEQRYQIRIDPPEEKGWGVRAMCLRDPAGVRWQIGHLLID
jgi:catechol 2,3-dioxygenase-like lactoylglutathione lyase family enzyme